MDHIHSASLRTMFPPPASWKKKTVLSNDFSARPSAPRPGTRCVRSGWFRTGLARWRAPAPGLYVYSPSLWDVKAPSLTTRSRK